MSKRLLVGGLSYNFTEDSLRETFASFGEVMFVKIIRDFRSGITKGYGFVEFDNTESATAALSMNGKEIDGRKLTVTFAPHILS